MKMERNSKLLIMLQHLSTYSMAIRFLLCHLRETNQTLTTLVVVQRCLYIGMMSMHSWYSIRLSTMQQLRHTKQHLNRLSHMENHMVFLSRQHLVFLQQKKVLMHLIQETQLQNSMKNIMIIHLSN